MLWGISGVGSNETIRTILLFMRADFCTKETIRTILPMIRADLCFKETIRTILSRMRAAFGTKETIRTILPRMKAGFCSKETIRTILPGVIAVFGPNETIRTILLCMRAAFGSKGTTFRLLRQPVLIIIKPIKKVLLDQCLLAHQTHKGGRHGQVFIYIVMLGIFTDVCKYMSFVFQQFRQQPRPIFLKGAAIKKEI
ncbi:hypothetical protein [Peribacillus sp. SCS-37]|uniref:hypothetical protein n=1 Tax=Paraperibacillus esterisolvens TaxID=3115296 RepID=UPI003905D8CE